MRSLIHIMEGHGIALGERGGVALVMLLSFMVLAVPIALASAQTASQLSRSSRVHEKNLSGSYDAASGVEAVLWQVANEPGFDDGLDSGNPSAGTSFPLNGDSIQTNVTKIFSPDTLVGQGLVVSKTVSPTTAPADTLTTYTYTITFKNEGTDTVSLEKIVDYLPPFLSYVPFSTSGVTTVEPTVSTTGSELSCGTLPYTLEWSLFPIPVEPFQEVTLTFQASGTLPDGTYYNQARATYEPWWDIGADVEIYTPYTAEVVAGTGTAICGFYADIIVDKSVSPSTAEFGVPTEFTYTITVENTSASDELPLQTIEDLLPPGFTYVTGSTTGFTTGNPALTLDPDLQRWLLVWGGGAEATELATVPASSTVSMQFRALGTLEPGLNYLNEVSAGYKPPAPVFESPPYADVVLVLDNSISVSSSELVDLKRAANAMVEAFNLSGTQGAVRIGITRFRGVAASVVEMTDIDEHDLGGFVYVDDPFRGTTEPSYAEGTDLSIAGYSGGALQVLVGAVDDSNVYDMSGGWQTSFNFVTSTEAILSFRYNLTIEAGYESDEYSEVIATVDGVQYGAVGSDYVARLTGNGNGGSDDSTGWQLFQVNLGTLAAGSHTLTIGAYNSKKTTTGEITTLLLDMVNLTGAVCATNGSPLIDAHFDSSADGGAYVDDAFRSTSEPSYASGTWSGSAGMSGGGLQVKVGGIDNNDIYGMSGGWQHGFNVAAASTVAVSFYYNLIQGEDYESSEYSDVIVTVDGAGGSGYVARITGDGNGGGGKTTGWQLYTVYLDAVTAGAHTLTVGAYNNKKTTTSAETEVRIDDILAISYSCSSFTAPHIDAGFDGNTPLHDGINGLVQGAPDLSGGTDIVAGLDSILAQFASGLGDRPEVPNLVIFMTDGDDNEGNTIQDIENAAAASGAELFAVGVGSGVNSSTLDAIATDPNEDHVFSTSDFSGLVELAEDIVEAALGGATSVLTSNGGASQVATVSGGTIYDVESISPSGKKIRARALVMSDGTIKIISWQER